MIRAHMATFPLRREIIGDAVARIAQQVDHLTVVLNEYDTIPSELASFSNVEPIIPDSDLKDVGKFLPEVEPDDRVFLVDDDILYPSNYVRRSLRLAVQIGMAGKVFGYHGARYAQGSVTSARSRRLFAMNVRQRRYVQVDQLGTGTVLLMGAMMPKLSLMVGSQKFVDVRFARLMFERGIQLWTLPRAANAFPSRLGALEEDKRQTIAASFTRRWPQEVLDEATVYAGVAERAIAAENENENAHD